MPPRNYGERKNLHGGNWGTADGASLFSISASDWVNGGIDKGFRASWVRNYGERKNLHGGNWVDRVGAGVFLLYLHYARTFAHRDVRFRASELW